MSTKSKKPQQFPRHSTKSTLLRLIPPLVIVLAALGIYFFVDFTVISDWARGLSYEPTTEMSNIITELDLTDGGERIFRASHATLKDNPAFGNTCGSDSEGTSILGCYTDGAIYIKNITDPALSGIQQSTSAHELLHAAWSRLPSSRRTELSKELESVYRAHENKLSDRLAKYEESRRYDELHSLVGTEIPEIPTTLRDHYAEYFNNRTKIVSYYTAYSSTFETLRAESESLKAQIDQKRTQIDAETENYEDGVEELNIAIDDFRRRAENGSFGDNIAAFNREQSELQRRADALNALFKDINQNITEVNTLIDKYNQNSAALSDLSTSLHSPSTPPSV